MQKITAEKVDLEKTTLAKFKKERGVQAVSDTYAEQLEELFLVRNPKHRFDKNYQRQLESFVAEHLAGRKIEQAGIWLYFEWRKTLVHLLPDELYQEVRTSRNRNLITADEQRKLLGKTVAVTGLSVGSHCAINIALSGIGSKFKFSDFDTISASNLNRILSGTSRLGHRKSDWISHTILEINPYAEIYVYEEGISPENVQEFIEGSARSPKVDLLVEELDSLNIKIILREQARQNKIPVVMVTDTENPVIDIERYDREADLPIFNGLIGESADYHNVVPADMVKMVVKIIGPDNFSIREQHSMLAVGKEIYSWPQLGAQAGVAGGIAAYLVRKILLGTDIRSGKYNLNIDSLFDAGYRSPAAAQERRENSEDFKKKLGL